MNFLYVIISAVIGFALGYAVFAIPAARNRLKAENKRFTLDEMENRRRMDETPASGSEEYSRVQNHL